MFCHLHTRDDGPGTIASMTTTKTPGTDHSTPLALPTNPWVRIWKAEAGAFGDKVHSWTGQVHAIEPLEPGRSVRVTLVDHHGEPVAPLGLELPGGCQPPARIGERLEVRVRARVLGFHPVIEGAVVDEHGVLRAAAVSDSPALLLPSDWSVERGPVRERSPARHPGMAEQLAYWVVVRHGDRTAWIGEGLWRTLSTASGSYWIGGRSWGWGPGNLVPDASDGTDVWIVRVQ